MRSDRQTGRTKLIVAFRNFVKAPENLDPAWGLAVCYCEEDDGQSSVNTGVFLYHPNYF